MLLCLTLSTVAEARPPRTLTSTPALASLRGAAELPEVDLLAPRDLPRFRSALDAAAKGAGEVRVLQLGDSHIAADLIASATRATLEARFGRAGRGLVHADQRWGFGGRRLKRRESSWHRTRIVEPKGPGGRYGLFGLALRAERRGARVTYRVLPEDRRLELHFEGGGFELRLDGAELVRVEAGDGTTTATVGLGPSSGPRTLEVRALGRGATLYGLGFFTAEPGLVWSSIGPVGADARVYLQMEAESFRADLQAHRPHLVVLMVGGNDALKVRKGWRSLAKVEADLRQLVALLQGWQPGLDVLVMAPMDAGRRRGGRVVSRSQIEPVRDFQRSVAEELGLGFWDTLQAMGGSGSVAVWTRLGLMAGDLVHPRGRGADLLGQAFGEALLRWYDARRSL